MSRTLPKTLKIVKRKLERSGRQYYGLATLEGKSHARITINPNLNQTEREFQNTAVHEAIHIGAWMAGFGEKKKDLTEKEINTIAANVVDVLWRLGYRRACK